jgi:hypothetical protein
MRFSSRSVVVAIAAVILLSGCGRAGRPQPPEGSKFPLFYPAGQATPTPAKQTPGRAYPPEWDDQDLSEAQKPFVDPSIKYQLLLAPGMSGPSGANRATGVGADTAPASALHDSISPPGGGQSILGRPDTSEPTQ